ncbi:MAG: cell wall-binding protein, partial [Blautia hydrogenotrophica]
MGKRKRNWKFWCLLLLMLFFAGGVTLQTTTSEVQAATKTKSGWETTAKGKYYYKNGKACTGWQTIGKKKYYFNPSTKLM